MPRLVICYAPFSEDIRPDMMGLTTSSSLGDLTTSREGSADEGAPTSRDC
jgi:hypothetical protein